MNTTSGAPLAPTSREALCAGAVAAYKEGVPLSTAALLLGGVAATRNDRLRAALRRAGVELRPENRGRPKIHRTPAEAGAL